MSVLQQLRITRTKKVSQREGRQHIPFALLYDNVRYLPQHFRSPLYRVGAEIQNARHLRAHAQVPNIRDVVFCVSHHSPNFPHAVDDRGEDEMSDCRARFVVS